MDAAFGWIIAVCLLAAVTQDEPAWCAAFIVMATAVAAIWAFFKTTPKGDRQ